MDIGLREWLFIIGGLVLLFILFDGWRRRQHKATSTTQGHKHTPKMDDDPVLRADAHHEPSLGSENLFDDISPDFDEPHHAREPALSSPTPAASQPRHHEEPTFQSHTVRKPVARAASTASTAHAATTKQPQDYLLIRVISLSAEGFTGSAIMQSLLESGLMFGERDMFYRYNAGMNNQEVLFKVMNGAGAGNFNVDDVDNFRTRVMAFFVELPGPEHPRQAFEMMLVAARKLAIDLDGDACDDRNNSLTNQTVEHYRQRIAEFERHHALRR